MHHPRYSVSGHKGKTGLAAVWRLLADRRVTLALAGHTHSYERWTSLNRDGAPDPRGVTQLIAGAGGHEAIPPLYSDSRLVSAVPVTGALRLDLGADGADFAYLSTDGSVHDSGFVGCKSTGDTLPPSRPAGLTATATSGTSADLAWQPSTDPAGLGGYRVRRNGRVVATVGPSATSYAEAGLVGGSTYVWTVDAFDPSENYSQQSVTSPASGYDLTVDVWIRLDDLFEGQDYSMRSNVLMRVKRENEVSDFNGWNVIFSPTGYRHVVFTAKLVAGDKIGKRASGYLGSTIQSNWDLSYDPETSTLRINANQRGDRMFGGSEFPKDELNAKAVELGLIPGQDGLLKRKH